MTQNELLPFEELIERISANEKAIEWLQESSLGVRRLMTFYECAIMEIETKFQVLNKEFSLKHDRNPINSIQSRLKSVHSIIEKLKQNNYPITLYSMEENIHDIAGVRVICAFPEDIYTLRCAFLQQDDITLLEEKDYVRHPKANGYRSLHLIIEVPIFFSNQKRFVKVEIQMRTIAMDFWASLEHQLRYKKNREFTDDMASELLACAEISSALDQRMDDMRRRTLS